MTLPLFEDPVPSVRRVTLIRLAGEIARNLASLGTVVVEGEIYRPKTSQGGTVFADLRDRAAQLSLRVPAKVARRSRLTEGERVSVVGCLQWSNDRGQVQFVAEEILPVGEGAVAALIARTRATLESEGILARPRRPIPVLPAAIGVVCGTEAAVRKDIESVVAARCPGFPVVFLETTVSGPGAAVPIVAAIEALSVRPGVEVIVLARGGGDAPSLLPWSSEEVCRAIAACPVPVVSAIGHESDHPLCDDVADVRYGTPSLAATAVLPDLDALSAAVDATRRQAWSLVSARLEMAGRRAESVDVLRSVTEALRRAEERVERGRIRVAASHPGGVLVSAGRRLEACGFRRPLWETLGRAEGRLDAERRHLHALSPRRTVERGYAVVTRANGSVLRRAGDVEPGERLGVTVAEGSLDVEVVSVRAGGDGSDG